MIDTFLLLSPQNLVTISIGLKMYFLITKNSARGSVGLSDRLGGRDDERVTFFVGVPAVDE